MVTSMEIKKRNIDKKVGKNNEEWRRKETRKK